MPVKSLYVVLKFAILEGGSGARAALARATIGPKAAFEEITFP
jgi:hypothetical protein